ncbi:Hypothetical predicted protein [Paramuricea clavata]|uniref:Uncharacterized protein n=1 Tax=Paramuricea clavata TaxID=317549 RepID=A0A6S7HQG4_PARCT|nr:Hypothetical predicted protein [Paramuricea clavata]
MFEIAVEEKIFLVQPIQAPSRFWELHIGQVMLHVKFKVLSKTAVPLNSKPCSNDVFGDTWRGHTKSLLIVYRYGRNTPQMKIAAENSCISVSIREPQPYADLIDPQNLLEDSDRFALVSLNGMFISCDSQLKLVAAGTTAEQGCKLIVRKDISTSPCFKMQNETGKFFTVGDGNYLYATGNKLFLFYYFHNKFNCCQSKYIFSQSLGIILQYVIGLQCHGIKGYGKFY